MKCVLYDHAFNQADWKNLMLEWKGEPTLVLARTFTRGFMEQEWSDYLKEVKFAEKMGKGSGDPDIILGQITGDFVQNEIKDLGFIIQTDPRGMYATAVNHDELPTVTVQIYKGNCLAFHDINIGEEAINEYINKLNIEMESDTSHSYVKEREYLSRIKAIKMTSRDALLTVKAGTTLESKLIRDKIDDCISIVNSALNSGIVPNMLSYAHRRMNELKKSIQTDTLYNHVVDGIIASIEGLFNDVWVSKYGTDCNNETIKDFYSRTNESYDIVSNSYVCVENLPTSAQYDLEVVVASLSIVKYLITGRALIFDAHILPTINDGGHYTQQSF